jgi:hypothetical protein
MSTSQPLSPARKSSIGVLLPPLCNALIVNELQEEPAGLAASGQRRLDAAWQQLASDDALLVLPFAGRVIPFAPDVARLAEAWPNLPPHIREAILTLVDAGVFAATAEKCR